MSTTATAKAEGTASSTERTTGGTIKADTRSSLDATTDDSTISAEVHYRYIRYTCEAASYEITTAKL